MKEIDHTVDIDHGIAMKEIGPMVGIDCQNTTKMTIKERIIALFRTMERGENIKIIKIIIIRTNVRIKFYMIEIDHMTEMIHVVEIGLLVEIGHKTIIEMSIKRKVINIREGLENEDAYEDRHSRNKYKHQYRNDSYDRSRSRSRKKSH